MAVFLVLWNPIGRTWLCSDKGIQVTVLLKGNRNSCGDCWREKKKKTHKGAIISLVITWRNQKKMELSRVELSWFDLICFTTWSIYPHRQGAVVGAFGAVWEHGNQRVSEWVSDSLIDFCLHLASSLGPCVLKWRNFVSQICCGCPVSVCVIST